MHPRRFSFVNVFSKQPSLKVSSRQQPGQRRVDLRRHKIHREIPENHIWGMAEGGKGRRCRFKVLRPINDYHACLFCPCCKIQLYFFFIRQLSLWMKWKTTRWVESQIWSSHPLSISIDVSSSELLFFVRIVSWPLNLLLVFEVDVFVSIRKSVIASKKLLVHQPDLLESNYNWVIWNSFIQNNSLHFHKE